MFRRLPILILSTATLAIAEPDKPEPEATPASESPAAAPTTDLTGQALQDRLKEIRNKAKSSPEVLTKDQELKQAQEKLKSEEAAARNRLDPEDRMGHISQQLKTASPEEKKTLSAELRELRQKLEADPAVAEAKKVADATKQSAEAAFAAAAAAIDPGYEAMEKKAKQERKGSKKQE